LSVLNWVLGRREGGGGCRRWADSSTRHDKVVVVAHAAHGLDNLVFIVGNDLYALKLNSEGEAELGEESGVCVDGLMDAA
jgi:hypothetical protein